MKNVKIYKARVSFAIIIDLFWSIAIIAIFTAMSIWFITTMDYSKDGFWIGAIFFFSFVIFIVSCYGFLPIYLCWHYYQKEKNVTVFIDYEKSELQYIEQGKEVQNIRFEDIVVTEMHCRKGIGVGYDEFILNNGKSIIITSLLGSIYIPNIPHSIIFGRLLLPKEEY